MIWEHTHWKYLCGLPRFLSGDMLEAKSKLIEAFTMYTVIPREERKDAGYFVQAAENMLHKASLSEKEIGDILMLQYWAQVV